MWRRFLSAGYRCFGPKGIGGSHAVHRCSAPPLPAGRITALQAVDIWKRHFLERGVTEPEHSSHYIIAYLLGAKTIEGLEQGKLTEFLRREETEQMWQLCTRRLSRMPVQYVIEEWDFRDLTLKMRPPVFIPRPETEELVDLVFADLERKPVTGVGADAQQTCLEVGCGSGAISLSLLKSLPQFGTDTHGHQRVNPADFGGPLIFPAATSSLAHVLPDITEEEFMTYTATHHQGAIDMFWLHFSGVLIMEIVTGNVIGCILFKKDNEKRRAPSHAFHVFQLKAFAVDQSQDAVDLTTENALRLGLQDRLQVHHIDVMTDTETLLSLCSPVSALVSNPPYLFSEDMKSLEPEIFRFEDHAALDGGKDGLKIIKQILTLAPRILSNNGRVYLEVDPRHPPLIRQWVEANVEELHYVETRHDITGRPRYCILQKEKSNKEPELDLD